MDECPPAALAMIDRLRDAACRAGALVGMASATRLEVTQFEDVLAAVARLPDEGPRLDAITGLAPYVPADCFEALLSVVEALPIGERMAALRSLAKASSILVRPWRKSGFPKLIA